MLQTQGTLQSLSCSGFSVWKVFRSPENDSSASVNLKLKTLLSQVLSNQCDNGFLANYLNLSRKQTACECRWRNTGETGFCFFFFT